MFDQLKNFNYRSLLSTRRFLSLAIVVVVISVLIVVFGILPQFQNIFEVQRQVTTEARAVEALERKVAELDALPSSLIFAQADRLNEALPSHKPLLELLTSLQAVSAQAQVNVSEVDLAPGSLATESAQPATAATSRGRTTTGTAASSGAYDTLDVNLTINGSTEQINQFMSLIEQVTPITSVTSVSLQRQSRPNQPGLFFSAELRVTSYYFTQTIRAATDAPLPPIGPEEEAIVNDIAEFVTTPIPPQADVTGGGLEDLFGVTPRQVPTPSPE